MPGSPIAHECTMGSRAFTIAVASLALAVMSLPAAAQAETADERTAGRALNRGDELLRLGRHQEAIDNWRAGLRVMPHWILLLRIGNAFRQMNRCEPAVTYLRLGYDLRDETFTDAMLPRLQEAINECTNQLPSLLEVSADHGHATVTVDDRDMGTTPLDPIEVPAGVHTVEISREGFEGAETSIRTTPATTTFVRLSLTPDNAVVQADTDEDSQVTDRLTLARRRRAMLWGGLLLGCGALLGGGGAALIAIDEYELGGGQGISSLGPGVALAALGGLLISGGIALFVVHPPARGERAEQ